MEPEKSIWADVSGFSDTLVNYGGVDSFTIIDLTDKNEYKNYSSKHHETHSVKTLDEALAFYPNHTKVFMVQGGQPLKDFTHPENAVYVFGPDIVGQEHETVNADVTVGIPTVSFLWTVEALSITLYDRTVKA
jgi:tRNA(Leu) C34 or U34 (ribose-2'-O)-methylase TrmL